MKEDVVADFGPEESPEGSLQEERERTVRPDTQQKSKKRENKLVSTRF